ncbi:MAG: pseudouridine synthase [Rhizobiaceae bacterium]|nr:pseudouridine synthase [Rhizobiaceae bacterium]
MHDDKTKKRGKARQAEEARPEAGERIAKRLSRAGVASRRDAEALIADGRVRVNGKVLETPAFTVTDADRIEIDGEPIPAVERTRLFLFHKPAGVVTTNRDPEGRRTIFDVLPADLPRLMTIGRLDINTEGLLLLTNDGGLARVLELPQTGWLRRYRVRVHGEVDEGRLAALKDGVAVDGVFYGAVEASLERLQGTNAWISVGLREGKNREVKNIMASLGLEVTRLIRVSFGPFQLGELAEGAVQEIRGRMLRDQLGPRLIEEAGANFDAPEARKATPDREVKPERGERSGERPARTSLREEAGGLVKKFRRDREDARGKALSRLSTSAPPRGGEGRGGKRDEQRGPEPRKQRTANVWMAPGARPMTKKDEAPEGEERVVKVARKPGDRKAAHDAAARRYRPGRKERAAGETASEPPRREWKPRPEGEERPKREYRPRNEAAGADRPKREWKPRPQGEDRPKRAFKPRGDAPQRDWKAKPPRAGKAERAEAKTTGEAPAREYRPRPKPRDGDERPQREWKPRPEGAERPKRAFKPRAEGVEAGERPKREWKPRAEGAERPKRDFKPADRKPFARREDGGERPARKFDGKPRGDRPGGGRPFAGKPGGKPGVGPRKGPPKGGPRGGKPGSRKD